MYMSDWKKEVETALKLFHYEVLEDKGKISHKMAVVAISDNMISWVSNGIEYYVVSDNMSESELMSVASSVGTMPVSK